MENLDNQGVSTQYMKKCKSSTFFESWHRDCNLSIGRILISSDEGDDAETLAVIRRCSCATAWGAYKSIEDEVKKTKNTRLRAHLFNSTVLPALTYASETRAFCKQEQNSVSVIEPAAEMQRVFSFTQVKGGIRSSLLRQRWKIRDPAALAKESKMRWAGHVVRFNDNGWTRAVSDWVPSDIKRTTGRPPTRWSDFFTKSFKKL
ncbi:hypothetical protein RB195_012071 [Necator americanus]|uniref:Uncharacterized protein n=1 Tax=Necator americanus TaxID=51031 RepID=A0ABR1D6B8_NECAM